MEKLQQLALAQILNKQTELNQMISSHGRNTLGFIHCQDTKTPEEISEMASTLIANHSMIDRTSREISEWLSALNVDLMKNQ